MACSSQMSRFRRSWMGFTLAGIAGLAAGGVCWPAAPAQAAAGELVVVPQAPRTVTMGVAGGLRPATSSGPRPVQWSATGLPPGMSVNYIDGTVLGTPTATGSFTTTLTAIAADGARGSTTVRWTVTPAVTGTSWYLDCSAASNGSGSSSAPWNNLASASAHVFMPGDKLLLKRGTTCTGQLAPHGDGASGAPITIDAYGTGAAPLVAGNGITGQPVKTGGTSVGGGAVQLTNQSYWTIKDLQVTNTAAGAAQRDGIEVLITDAKVHNDIIITGNDVHNVTGDSDRSKYSNGFYLSHGIGVDVPIDGGYINNLGIWYNTVHQVYGNGIGIYGDQGEGNGATNSQIVHNQGVVVSNNTLTDVSNDGIVVCVSDSPLIKNNTASYLGWNAPDNPTEYVSGMWAWGVSNPTFQFNEVSHITAPATVTGGDMEAWDCDGHITGTCTYQDNYDHDNFGGIFLNCTICGGTDQTAIVFRHNVSINDCRIADPGDKNVASFAFYGNTIDCRTTDWNVALPGVTVVSDNIFLGDGGPRSTLPANATYRANTYRGFTTTLPTDPQGSTKDPLLVQLPAITSSGVAAPSTMSALGGYELQTGSPAIGTGVQVHGDSGYDIWKDPVIASVNRGAYIGTGVS